MKFKSRISTPFFMYSIKGTDQAQVVPEHNFTEKFKFDGKYVRFSKKQIDIYGDQLSLNPFNAKIADWSIYTLERTEYKRKYTYSASIVNFKVELKPNWWNERKLKWIHEYCWIQSDKAEWFRKQIFAYLIGAATSIITYFVGLHIGHASSNTDDQDKGKTQVLKVDLKQNTTQKNISSF
jgi:hypothetical protein